MAKRYQCGAVYLIARSQTKAIFRIHASKTMIFEMSADDWDALPELNTLTD